MGIEYNPIFEGEGEEEEKQQPEHSDLHKINLTSPGDDPNGRFGRLYAKNFTFGLLKAFNWLLLLGLSIANGIMADFLARRTDWSDCWFYLFYFHIGGWRNWIAMTTVSGILFAISTCLAIVYFVARKASRGSSLSSFIPCLAIADIYCAMFAILNLGFLFTISAFKSFKLWKYSNNYNLVELEAKFLKLREERHPFFPYRGNFACAKIFEGKAGPRWPLLMDPAVMIIACLSILLHLALIYATVKRMKSSGLWTENKAKLKRFVGILAIHSAIPVLLFLSMFYAGFYRYFTYKFGNPFAFAAFFLVFFLRWLLHVKCLDFSKGEEGQNAEDNAKPEKRLRILNWLERHTFIKDLLVYGFGFALFYLFYVAFYSTVFEYNIVHILLIAFCLFVCFFLFKLWQRHGGKCTFASFPAEISINFSINLNSAKENDAKMEEGGVQENAENVEKVEGKAIGE